MNMTVLILFVVVIFTSQLSFCEYFYKTEFFETKVDHFSFSSNATFKIRYLINDSNWSQESDDPIFLYTGNEADINDFAQNIGFIWEVAPEFNALVVFAEHRYYGKSLPFGNKSKNLENLGYLSSSQVLMDYVELVEYLRGGNKQHKVFAVGGSYGGILAAWIRIKYPATIAGCKAKYVPGDGALKTNAFVAGHTRHTGEKITRRKYKGKERIAFTYYVTPPHLKTPVEKGLKLAPFHMAIASSAPIWQFTDMTTCDSFNKRLTSTFKMISSTCSNNIQRSWNAINDITKTDTGKFWLSTTWKLCSPLETAEDISNLKAYLWQVYINLAMINYPYPNGYPMSVPAYAVKAACSHLLREYTNREDLLRALLKTVSVFANHTGNVKCIDYTDPYSRTSIDTDVWKYQACTELVVPMCANGITDMFEPTPWNFSFYKDYCFKTYKVKPQPFFVRNMYGGKDISSASNIIFSNGLLDPWASGGVLRNVSETVQAVAFPKGAHHMDLKPTNPADPTSVVKARAYYRQVLRQWTKHTD